MMVSNRTLPSTNQQFPSYQVANIQAVRAVNIKTESQSFEENNGEHAVMTQKEQFDQSYGGYQGAERDDVMMARTIEDWTAVDEKIKSFIGRDAVGKYVCKVCGYKAKNNVKRHIELHIETPGYNCIFCRKLFKTRSTLTYHLRSVHKEEKIEVFKHRVLI